MADEQTHKSLLEGTAPQILLGEAKKKEKKRRRKKLMVPCFYGSSRMYMCANVTTVASLVYTYTSINTRKKVRKRAYRAMRERGEKGSKNERDRG